MTRNTASATIAAAGGSSARETAARVAAGAIARKVIPGVTIRGALVQIGKLKIDRANWDWEEVGRNPFFCPDAAAAGRFADYLDDVRKAGSSVGAVVEIVAEGVPAGWGAPIYGKLDAELAGALMSVNAVKGVEIGDGFAAAELTGEENADEMRAGAGRAAALPLQSRRRHSRRHLDRAADRRPLRRQADLVDPDAAAHGHPCNGGDRDRHQGPPRPLRRHPRRPRRRGDGGLRAGGRVPAPSGPGRLLGRVPPAAALHTRVASAAFHA